MRRGIESSYLIKNAILFFKYKIIFRFKIQTLNRIIMPSSINRKKSYWKKTSRCGLGRHFCSFPEKCGLEVFPRGCIEDALTVVGTVTVSRVLNIQLNHGWTLGALPSIPALASPLYPPLSCSNIQTHAPPDQSPPQPTQGFPSNPPTDTPPSHSNH